MKTNQLKVGLKVKTKVSNNAYYGGIIVKGEIGTIGAINCPNVRTKGVFQCVDFVINGEKKRASYHVSELEKV